MVQSLLICWYARYAYDSADVDLRRQPNPHLVFGHGPHFCLGAHLARTSALTYAGPLSYLRSNFQRGVKRLPVAWHS